MLFCQCYKISAKCILSNNLPEVRRYREIQIIVRAKKYKFKQVRYEINFSNVEMVMAMIKGEFLILFKGG